MKKMFTLLGLLMFTIVPSTSLASIDVNLKYGSRGQAVTELQDFLISKGLLASQTTGNFYSLTNKAVIAYQASVGLPQSGYVGPLTRTKINAELANLTQAQNTQEIAETGITTTLQQNDKVSLLQQQILLLQQQLDSLRQSQNTQNQQNQQLQQTLNQIAQKTTPTNLPPSSNSSLSPISNPVVPTEALCIENPVLKSLSTQYTGTSTSEGTLGMIISATYSTGCDLNLDTTWSIESNTSGPYKIYDLRGTLRQQKFSNSSQWYFAEQGSNGAFSVVFLKETYQWHPIGMYVDTAMYPAPTTLTLAVGSTTKTIIIQ